MGPELGVQGFGSRAEEAAVTFAQDVGAAVEGSRGAPGKDNDPFSRRQTQSQNYWTTRREGASSVLCEVPVCLSIRLALRSIMPLA